MNLKDIWNESKHRKRGDSAEVKLRIEERTKEAEVCSPEWIALRAAMKQEVEIENLRKEHRKGFLGISGEKWLGAALVIGGLTLALVWDTESPAALKFSKLVWDMVKKA